MPRPAARIAFIQAVLAVAVAAVLLRSAKLQILDGRKLAAEAVRQRTKRVQLPAARGVIADRAGVRLADTRESYHVGIAPNEIESPHEIATLVARSLDRTNMTQAALERRLRTSDAYVSFWGPYSATQVDQLRTRRGVHLETNPQRIYPAPDLARGAIGAVDADTGRSGMERMLDSLLRGVPGEEVNLRDPRRRLIVSPRRLIREPVPGNDIILTIDAGLQEIVERALDHAIEQLKARSAEAVFLDPRNGEVLAIASRQADGAVSNSALLSPFEPGSTAKLFTAAALLSLGRVDSTDTIDPEGGRWEMPIRGRRATTRTISDAHPEHEALTLARVIEVSSNIGMAKFSQRLTADEQFAMLRAFGFGTPTGVEVAGEVGGRLVPPDGLSSPDFVTGSWAMGYQLTVTAMQLAAAYGVIANDGVLMAPTLVREIRGPDGTVLYRHQPEPVRRVISPAVAATLRRYLAAAVAKGGTGEQAQLQNYRLVGKTGTSHQTENGRYVDRYNASFAAIFPADRPQLVAVVKVDAPGSGSYYGGQTAAPLVKEMLYEALASPSGVINRNLFAGRRDTARVELAGPAVPSRVSTPPPVVAVSWPYRERTPKAVSGPVPDVTGASVRAAVAALHRRGYRVALHGVGSVTRTEPAAGDTAAAGTVVTVWTGP
jgi:cell division protein FtsI (penicillin-binding protein 3)